MEDDVLEDALDDALQDDPPLDDALNDAVDNPLDHALDNALEVDDLFEYFVPAERAEALQDSSLVTVECIFCTDLNSPVAE